MKSRIRATVLLALAGVFAASCSSDTTGTATGQVKVLLTDAPFPFSEVKSVDVFVTRIDGKTGETDDVEAENENESDGWHTLVSPGKSLDLLTLMDGKTANLGTATLPVGTYKSFRLVIDPAQSSVTLTDNTKPEVKWPGSGKNGIKVILDQPFNVVNGTTNMLIDFDVGKSFVMRGNSISNNGLLFKPVIHATTVTQ